jgi:hypothetical protein
MGKELVYFYKSFDNEILQRKGSAPKKKCEGLSIQSWCQRAYIRCHPVESAKKKKSKDGRCEC